MSDYPLHDELLSRRKLTSEELLFTVKSLIDAGADVNQRDLTSRTPLECCVDLDVRLRSVEAQEAGAVYASVIELLLKKGADPDLRDSRGWSLLHLAAWKSDLFFIKLCVQLGRGNVQATNHDNQLPVHLAALKSHTHITHYLDSRSGDLRSMCRAVIRTALGKRCHEINKLILPPRLKFFLNYNIPYRGFSTVLVPPEPWTPAQLYGKEVEGDEMRQFIRTHASQEFLLSHMQELGEGQEEESGKNLVELFQEMYLWEAFKSVDYEEPLPRAPRYALVPIDKSRENKD